MQDITRQEKPPLTINRRVLHFQSLTEIQADIASLLEQGRGEIITTGKLTPAQNIGHVALFIQFSVHGFPYNLPWYMRIIGRLIRGYTLSHPFPEGLQMPARFSHIQSQNFPPADALLATSVDSLNQIIEAASQPEAMRCPSPMFGKLSHQQWTTLHCLHANLHFSFLHPANVAQSEQV